MKKLIFAVIAGVAVAGAVQAQETYPKTYVGVGVVVVGGGDSCGRCGS